MTPLINDLLLLTREALAHLDRPREASSALRKATRVARMRGDVENLWWIEQELMPNETRRAANLQLIAEIAPNYSRDAFREVRHRLLMESLEIRKLPNAEDERDRLTQSVPESEAAIADGERLLARPTTM